jgi:protein-disulfide isomerase
MRIVGWTVVTTAAFAAGLSAVWFVIIQLLVLKTICFYCMIAHAFGLVAAGTMLLAAPLRKQAKVATAAISFAGFAVLVVGQILTRTPETHRIERFTPSPEIKSEHLEFAPPIEKHLNDDEGSDDNLLDSPLYDDQSSALESLNIQCAYISSQMIDAAPRILFPIVLVVEASEHKPVDRRLIAIQGGNITLDIDQWPLSGPRDAKYVFVELFDYHCLSCRETHQAITGAKKKLGEELAVVCLPIPITPACNPFLRAADPQGKKSYNLANLAVAVWRVDETCFERFHDWMFEGPQAPSYDDAKARAAKLVGIKNLDNELASGIPERYVATHVELYKKIGAGTIPKLMFPHTNVVGEYTSIDGLIELIQREAK